MLTDETRPTRADHSPYVPLPPAEGLPERLAITLWDFSWYVRTGPGEPFEDLRKAADEAVERGYNTIRICAMPFLLFGSGLDTTGIELDRLGGEYAQGVRWYDVKARSRIDGREHLLALFRACKEAGLYVILSSWEYQQSSAFSADSAWWDALSAVDPEDRATRLAESLASMVDFLAEHDLDDRIAFTELHNEVQFGHLTEGLRGRDEQQRIAGLRPRLERAIDRFHELQPHQPVTANFARVPVEAMRHLPSRVDVLVFHPYVYGVLDEVTEAFDLRGSLEDFPRDAVEKAGILRHDAPPATEWVLPEASRWKMEATIVGKPEIFLHDWVDAEAFDRFLYERYESHDTEMHRVLSLWMDAAADRAAERGVPFVFGEGWIGYTPLRGTFEEGPVGAEFCRFALRESRRVGAWGSIVCSNAAPQHPMWRDVRFQAEANAAFLE